MFDLSGKLALVTGATGAIGGAISRCLHAMGASVALSGTRVDTLESLAQELSERVHLFSCNLTQPEAVEELIPNVEKVFNHNVNILVNNAGITRDNLLLRLSNQDWQDVMMINLEAPFRLMRAAVRNMMQDRWGRIINISSIVGAIGNPGQANYSASKSALFGLSKSAAAELATRNITVNCIAPGFIDSNMTKQLSEMQQEMLKKQIPMGRIGKPEEVAAGVAFLASEEASYVTGHVLHINGGMAMV